ncbi:MAG: DUF1893 domain-containing protein [Synergistaceae bacterium]|jgi:hypothetical protein|nr:DUF1893 domain-containing protein [Synergistaceae bacterium]
MDESIFKAANKAKSALTHGGKTLVVIGDGKILHHSDQRGLTPLLNILDADPAKLEGAVIGDRFVGLASAFLCIYGRAKAVFALTIADDAIDLLGKHGVLATWQQTVPYIVERDLTSRYKLDLLVKDVEYPPEAAEMIRKYIANCADIASDGTNIPIAIKDC